jgi:hypothetical protein
LQCVYSPICFTLDYGFTVRLSRIRQTHMLPPGTHAQMQGGKASAKAGQARHRPSSACLLGCRSSSKPQQQQQYPCSSRTSHDQNDPYCSLLVGSPGGSDEAVGMPSPQQVCVGLICILIFYTHINTHTHTLLANSVSIGDTCSVCSVQRTSRRVGASCV